MKGFIGFLLSLLSANLISQNLIPNPGFDIISQCPDDYRQINYAPPWVSANNGTPDLYNECSTQNGLQVPNAGQYFDSYQLQRSGTGYASIVVYYNGNSVSMECIETPLTTSLIKGKDYYIEFYVSPDLSPTSLWHYTDAIGLALTDSFFYQDIGPHVSMSLIPVIENPPILITDTISWTRINGCYQAKGGESHAIIGNFKSDIETTISVHDPNVFPYLIYYYIEDVLITPYDPFPDTIILCEDESIELKATFMDASYKWNTGETDSILVVKLPGKYSVETTINNCVLHDTVTVLNYLGEKPFPTDTVMCENETLVLTAPTPGTYLWSNGTSANTNTIYQSGNYSVSVTNICGTYIFDTDVQFELCDCKIFVPNVLSINNDGINDALTVNINCDFDYNITGFYIFDRWGNNLYTASQVQGQDIIWDGKFHGQSVQSGVYTWKMIYEINRGQEKEELVRTGNVTVMR